MSNGAKIAIGCGVFFLLTVAAVIGVVAFVSYKTVQTFGGMTAEIERTQTLNNKYPFTTPGEEDPLDAQRFDEYMATRRQILSEVKELSLVRLMMDANNPNAAQNFGMGDAFGMVGDVSAMFKSLNDNLDAAQMSPNEYDYFQEQMLITIFQAAENGDADYQTLWNNMESAASVTLTTWNGQEQPAASANQWNLSLADSFGIDTSGEFNPQAAEVLNNYKQELVGQPKIIYFEGTMLSANNSAFQSGDFSQFEQNTNFSDTDSSEEFQQMMQQGNPQPAQ